MICPLYKGSPYLGESVMECSTVILQYSQKYWRELNLAVGSQIAILNVLADLNLAVRYRIAIRIYNFGRF